VKKENSKGIERKIGFGEKKGLCDVRVWGEIKSIKCVSGKSLAALYASSFIRSRLPSLTLRRCSLFPAAAAAALLLPVTAAEEMGTTTTKIWGDKIQKRFRE
jgi:hypothetical protein